MSCTCSCPGVRLPGGAVQARTLLPGSATGARQGTHGLRGGRRERSVCSNQRENGEAVCGPLALLGPSRQGAPYRRRGELGVRCSESVRLGTCRAGSITALCSGLYRPVRHAHRHRRRVYSATWEAAQPWQISAIMSRRRARTGGQRSGLQICYLFHATPAVGPGGHRGPGVLFVRVGHHLNKYT